MGDHRRYRCFSRCWADRWCDARRRSGTARPNGRNGQRTRSSDSGAKSVDRRVTLTGRIEILYWSSSRHNDWAWLIRENFRNHLAGLDLYNMSKYPVKNDTPSHTDITRLRQGQVGGQVSDARSSTIDTSLLQRLSSGRSTPIANIKAKTPR